jgi:hypothetical protein
VRHEIDRLKTRYDGFHYRELARILSCTFGTPFNDRMVKKLWQQSPISCQGHLGLWDYHTYSDRYQARLRVVQLYYRGWDKVSISRFLRVSQPTADARVRRFEAEHFAGLVDKSRAPKAPIRKIWLPLMVQVYHLQKAHLDAGEFRMTIVSTQVLLWASGAQLRAVFENVVLADYRCHYEWRDRTVQDIQDGICYPARFASRQGSLIPLTLQDAGIVYHMKSPKRRVPHVSPPPQLLLFEVVATG